MPDYKQTGHWMGFSHRRDTYLEINSGSSVNYYLSTMEHVPIRAVMHYIEQSNSVEPYPNHKCLTIVSTPIYGKSFSLVNVHLDVEHAAENSGKQAQNALSLPQLHYEGFEPSPYDKNDARAEIDEGIVRIVSSLT